MFPRPVVQFLFRIKAPSITPMCLVSSEALTNPHTTIYISRKTDNGDFISLCLCLAVCLSISISFFQSLSIFHPRTITQTQNASNAYSRQFLVPSTKGNCCRHLRLSLKTWNQTLRRNTLPPPHIIFPLICLSVNQNSVKSVWLR